MNTIQQAHILLVDDNTDLLRLLEEQLRGAGYQNIRTVQNCAAAVPLCAGRRCRPLVRAGTGCRRLPDQAISDAGTAFAGAAPFAACLPDRAFPDKSSNLAAGRPERGPARCPCDPAGRNYPCPDSDRADAFAQAGRKPRAYRDLRCAVRSGVGIGYKLAKEDAR